MEPPSSGTAPRSDRSLSEFGGFNFGGGREPIGHDLLAEVDGVVGTADEGARGDKGEPHVLADRFVFLKLVRMNERHDGQVLHRGAEVLANRHRIDANCPQIAQNLEYFVPRLTQAEHDPGLCVDGGVDFLGHFQNAKRARVLRLGADNGVKPLDRLDIVIVNIGVGLAHDADQIRLGFEVRRKDLNDHVRVGVAQSPDRAGKLLSPLILQIVPRNARHDYVLQAEIVGDFGYVSRLENVNFFAFSDINRAKTATSSAGIAQNHKGGGFLAPAFGKIRTAGAFADRVKVLRAHHALNFCDRLGPGKPNRQPFG